MLSQTTIDVLAFVSIFTIFMLSVIIMAQNDKLKKAKTTIKILRKENARLLDKNSY